MIFRGSIILGLVVCVLMAVANQQPKEIPLAEGARFELVEVFVDSGAQPLAAWQVEFSATTGQVEIVGIERGDNAGFGDPPYYDPSALQKNRIVIGAFNLSDNLPAGKTRVARLHLHVSGPQKPVYAAKLMVAGNKEGKSIPAKASVETLSKPNKPEGDAK